MKTIESRTGELERDVYGRVKVVTEDKVVSEDERPTMSVKTLTPQSASSLKIKDTAVIRKRLRSLSERESRLDSAPSGGIPPCLPAALLCRAESRPYGWGYQRGDWRGQDSGRSIGQSCAGDQLAPTSVARRM